jgi:hypothetical protein
MRKRDQTQLRKRRGPGSITRLETWLALDRGVVELSMRAFNVPPRHQSVIREQQRRLHAALKQAGIWENVVYAEVGLIPRID